MGGIYRRERCRSTRLTPTERIARTVNQSIPGGQPSDLHCMHSFRPHLEDAMKLGRIAGIAATIIACSVWIGTFAEAKARHRAASAKTSTVTSFESAAGTRCHGTCFN